MPDLLILAALNLTPACSWLLTLWFLPRSTPLCGKGQCLNRKTDVFSSTQFFGFCYPIECRVLSSSKRSSLQTNQGVGFRVLSNSFAEELAGFHWEHHWLEPCACCCYGCRLHMLVCSVFSFLVCLDFLLVLSSG